MLGWVSGAGNAGGDAGDPDDVLAEIRAMRMPGIPGVLGDIAPVNSGDFGGISGDDGVIANRPVDPWMLARLVAVYLGIAAGNWRECVRQVAEDDREGPIHLVRLLAACEYAARATGGHLPGTDDPDDPDDPVAFGFMVTEAQVTRDGLPVLAAELRRGGLPAATRAARAMEPARRARVLCELLVYWTAPVSSLREDISEHFPGPEDGS
jgi:hypothetical protein